LDSFRAPVHAVTMRTAILLASLLGMAPALAQDAPSVWRDPDGGCTYLKLGDTLSLRYQRDGWPDCPDARREDGPSSTSTDQAGAVTRDDVRAVTRAIEGLSRRLDDVRREFERRGRFEPPIGVEPMRKSPEDLTALLELQRSFIILSAELSGVH
jgi:hypothetical protein